MASFRAPLLALASLLLLAVPAHAERRLSLRQAVALAVGENPELRLEDTKILEARERQRSTRGLYGPKLMADVSLLVWDSALDFKIDTSSLTSLDLTKLDYSKMGLTPTD